MPSAYKVLKQVTKLQLKLEIGTPYHLEIVSKIIQGKDLKGKGSNGTDGKKMEPPMLMEVIDLDAEIPEGRSAQVKEMIVNSVLKSNLEENYSKDGYVGRCFEITKCAQRKGKQYNDFEIAEIAKPK